MQAPRIQPSARVPEAGGYRPAGFPQPIDLWLNSNEGEAPEDLKRSVSAHSIARYPDASKLEARLAARLGVEPECVLVTAGADEALARLAQAVLEPGREVILPTPSFEMIERCARLAGAELRLVDWPPGPWPLEAILAARSEKTALLVAVTPNNPSGSPITREQLLAASQALPAGLILLDLAYDEFAEESLERFALQLDNVLQLRTLSKAYGLAGLRIGYALGSAVLIRWMRAVGPPYSVSGPSIELAMAALESPRALSRVAQIKRHREVLSAELLALGARPYPSQANFLLVDFDDSQRLLNGLASLGIAVRAFPECASLRGKLRITLPACDADFERLLGALRCALAPEALLLDMDGVLADVSQSQDQAILQTAMGFGVEVSAEALQAARDRGGANDDWALTQRLIQAGGVGADLRLVIERYEALYQGTPASPGLKRLESPLVDRPFLVKLSERFRLGIVTGRPKRDALSFLTRFELLELFEVLVTRDDAELKPSPAPVRLALKRLGVERAWMVGDTVDDVRAARAAGVLPLAVAPNGKDVESVRATLLAAGASEVQTTLKDYQL